MNLSKRLVVGALTLPLVLGGMSAFSATPEQTAEFAKAKINIFQAIRAAERHHPGRALSAQFDVMDGKGVYKVDVMNREKHTTEVVVDARSGKVTSAKAETGSETQTGGMEQPAKKD